MRCLHGLGGRQGDTFLQNVAQGITGKDLVTIEGLANSAVVTAANMHNKNPLPDLLHGNEQRVYGDSAYASQKGLIASNAPHAKDLTNQCSRYAGFVDEAVRAKNRNNSRIRSRLEHVFGVVKRRWGFGKVRYRGLQKNATRAFTALALANIYLGRQRLLAQVRT